ncbi:carcinoembryonic antigen-related cell adhesion molecule 1 [Octodon degus]|uniref:Carcinoembryonic antigen-related cell adhesion molecule 1 n=1 Tax=Octodon degus TaxID=10160 RepID=A0A6P6DKV4_OCTDE|nr:carcinoembryonic antigen-related cell adhesion molecule 1 [Octodon degus]
MEPRSATSHRGLVPWQGLLLAASLLTFWNPPTNAQLTIELVPFHAAEGGDVLLLVHNLPENRIAYNWFKGDRVDSSKEIATVEIDTNRTTPGRAYSHRETIYRNGSLLFKSVKQQDSGLYTLYVIKSNYQVEQASGQFQVHLVLPKPHITSNNSSPVEGEQSVVLTCEPETQDTTYLWWTNGQSLQDGDRLKLSNDSRILTLFSITKNDTGPYECETRNIVSGSRSDPFTLNIYYGPDDPIILPPETYFHPGTTLNLSCHAASNPAAQYHWLLNGSLLQSPQELHIPNVSANNSGSYTCLANNSATGLSRSTVKTVIVTDDSTQESASLSTGAIIGIVITVVAGVALITILVYCLILRKTGRASDQHDLTEHKLSVSNHSK